MPALNHATKEPLFITGAAKLDNGRLVAYRVGKSAGDAGFGLCAFVARRLPKPRYVHLKPHERHRPQKKRGAQDAVAHKQHAGCAEYKQKCREEIV